MNPSIRRVPVETDARSIGTTNAYVVGSAPAVVVDPGAASAELVETCSQQGVEHVLATHAHPDHVGGVADLAATLDAQVWARAGFESRFVDAADVAPDQSFETGARFAVGGDDSDEVAIQVLDAPGHAPDHVAFGLGGSALVGDLAVAEGSVAVAAPDGDVAAYLDTLRRLRGRGFERLYPGHGAVIDDPDAVLARLADHRLDRERRVLQAVRAGAGTLDAVLDKAYDEDLTGVRDLAEGTVVAHLEKLAADGEVEWDPSTRRVSPA